MIDPTKLLLYAVIITLTIIMVLIGWQMYKILTEIRKMLMKANALMDNSAKMMDNVGKSFEKLNGFSEGMKAAFSVIRFFKKGEKQDGK